MENKTKKIILSGGGTAGSVSPLLAVSESIFNFQSSIFNYEFLWIGTKRGLENKMVKKEGIEFKAIANGKLRRYFDWKNFIDPFKILVGFVQSIFIILKFKPDLVMSAGAFVSVPVVWAAWFLRVPVLIHQQDVRPGLANKLMAPFARVVTVTFEKSLEDYGEKAVWTGNPIRLRLTKTKEILRQAQGWRKTKKQFCHSEQSEESRDRKEKTGSLPAQAGFSLRLQDDKPMVLIVGGGTGAMAINKLVWESLDELRKFCNTIHITGKDKIINPPAGRAGYKLQITNYYPFEFLNIDEMAEALDSADIVVSRAGMGVLTELSYLGKPSIIIPIPGSHQEDNAKVFDEKEAAVVLDQEKLTKEDFVNTIKKLLEDKERQNKLGENIQKVIKKGANAEILKIVERII